MLYAYAGFPRSLNALGVLEKILNAKMVNGTLSLGTWQWGKPFVRPAVWDDAAEALRTGIAMQTRDEGGTPWDFLLVGTVGCKCQSFHSVQMHSLELNIMDFATSSAFAGGHAYCSHYDCKSEK